MVWKQDLAKLKAAIRDTGAPPPPSPKPKAKPVEVKELHEEDAFFLAAMGTATPRIPLAIAAGATPRPLPAAEPEATFEAELGALKGFKPMAANPLLDADKGAKAASKPVPVPLPSAEAGVSIPDSVALPPVAPTPSVTPAHGPQRINLAAGMAVEVDASLDLRHHSAADALGRVRDRVEDGALLGWRTLHVMLGEDEPLHAALLAFLAEGGAPKVSRFAQAPIPMGGAQAWILYY